MQNEEAALDFVELEEVKVDEIPLREEEQGDFILCQCIF